MRLKTCVIGILALVSACSVPRPQPIKGLVCGMDGDGVVTPLEVDLAPRASLADAAGKKAIDVSDGARAFYNEAIARAAARRSGMKALGLVGADAPIDQLVLSGGGQEGAFGVGFMKGGEGQRTYDIVTGVSTGALQGIFALLGTTRYNRGPFTGDFEPRVPGATAIDDLVSGYRITKPDSLFNNGGEISILKRAAQGNFKPLDKRIRELLQPDVFAKLDAVSDERQLYVALLDWDSGRVVIVDMMKLAKRHAGKFEMKRSCFTQVLLAASSEPLAVPPVNIDGTLYMDAGLRFGVFAKAAIDAGDTGADAEVARLKSVRGPVPLIAVRTDVIVNGRLDPAADAGPPPAKYNALDMLGRARKILVNQVYRFSVADAMRRHAGHATRLVYIDAISAPRVGMPKTRPFDPAYMKTLMAEGRERGASELWSIVCHPGADACTIPGRGSN